MALPTWAKVGIGWSVATVLGIYAFVLVKRNVNNRRYEMMKIRRLRDAKTVD